MSYTVGETLLKLEDVSLKFGEKQVLRDVNIEIKDISRSTATTGQVTTVVGRSGIGKSQLFKIIAGLIKPTTGKVLIGADQKPVVAGKVGMVLQNYPLFLHHTLLGNLELVCKDKSKIEHYLNEFDIADHVKKYPGELSGGQRQRAAIVQQLLCSENFILLDEPFSGLDPIATEKLCRNINKVANDHSHNTVLISSHILEPALAISDSVWVIGNTYEQVSETEKIVKPLGATILNHFNLAENGLAWRDDIRRDPRFISFTEDIRSLFERI